MKHFTIQQNRQLTPGFAPDFSEFLHEFGTISDENLGEIELFYHYADFYAQFSA